VRSEDIQLESLAQDVEQLIGIGVLQPASIEPASIDSIGAAEQAALDARRAAGLREDEPVWELVRVAERLGLYAFVLKLEGPERVDTDGSYVALERGGVALVNGLLESGRRRFTIAHELGHHVSEDEYDPEWVVGSDATEREKIVNAFAIHFLMPRPAVEPRWSRLGGGTDPRNAAIHLGVEFGLSWSAVCAQLHRVSCLSASQYDELLPQKPGSVDLVERELTIRNDVTSPLVPPGYAAAVIRALHQGKIGAERALELLHGTILDRDLPARKPLSLDAMKRELERLLD
jgi:Zn-dependent peptidase ImmA (M78 family)